MKIQNATSHVQVLGKTILEPGAVGVVPPEFWENETVEGMIKNSRFMLIPGEDAELSEVKEENPETATTSSSSSSSSSNGDNIEALLEKWNTIPAKQCKELVADSTQRSVLARMLPFEKRKTVKKAIEARLAELEEDTV